jgi:hypothetical protein
VNPAIERILVILDAAAETNAAISAAVRLAAQSRVPLHAVFIEEEDLLTLAALPIVRHFVPGGGRATLTGAEIELHWRAAAARAHDDLLAAASAQALECSFEVVRGTVEAALAAAGEGGLIVAGALTRPIAGHFRVQSPWLTTLETRSGALLLARQGIGSKGDVVALLRERNATAARLLQTAARLAELGGTRLTIIASPTLAAGKGLRNWISGQLEPALPLPEIEPAPSETSALARRILELDCRVLAIDASTTERDRLAELTERLACDILVVR